MNQTFIEIKQSDFKPGTTVVCAVKDRSEPLRFTISSWLLQRKIDHVILVDWDSDVPLIYSLASFESGLWPNDKVSIVRAENQPTWNMAKAINLGMKLVETEVTLKLDADIVMVDDLEGQELAASGQFFTSGNWKTARNPNECGLHGSTAFGAYDFWRVGGYDERFYTYGFEDDNFYARLRSIGVLQKQFSHNALFHLPHSDALRAANQDLDQMDLTESIRINRRLSKKRTAWSPKAPRLQHKLLTRSNDNRYFVVRESPLG